MLPLTDGLIAFQREHKKIDGCWFNCPEATGDDAERTMTTILKLFSPSYCLLPAISRIFFFNGVITCNDYSDIKNNFIPKNYNFTNKMHKIFTELEKFDNAC
jgi:hypothetical protein